MTEQKRHKDSRRRVGGYGSQYLVSCPKCGKGARIGNGRLTCPSCAHTAYNAWADPASDHFSDAAYRPGQGGPWYGRFTPFLAEGWNPKCQSCRAPVQHDLTSRDYGAPRPDKARITCPGCGEVAIHPIGWEAIAPTGAPTDPIFGCQYYLIETTRHGDIFAQNAEQLQDLRDFVAAGLRERNTGSEWMNASYISRLPRWIKVAKNRDTVLKACDQLLERARALS